MTGHRLCINCKLRLEEKAAPNEYCSPEFANASKHGGEAFMAQFAKSIGLRIFKASAEYVKTGSSEEISLETLLAKIQNTEG